MALVFVPFSDCVVLFAFCVEELELLELLRTCVEYPDSDSEVLLCWDPGKDWDSVSVSVSVASLPSSPVGVAWNGVLVENGGISSRFSLSGNGVVATAAPISAAPTTLPC